MANLEEFEGKDLTINDILGKEDKVTERLEISEWGGCVYIRIMSAKERSEMEDLFMKINESKKETGKFRCELIRRTWVDHNGALMITDDALASHMMGKNALAIEKIFEKACEVNAFRQKDIDTLKKK
jgi:hypothetical protein